MGISGIIGIIVGILTIITFCFRPEVKKFLNKLRGLAVRIFAWFIQLVRKKASIEIRIGGITTNSCSFCSRDIATRAVQLENGKQIDVCQECLNKQLKSRIWKQKANSEV